MDLRFKIKDIEIKGGLCLGPMAGVTDLPFRMLCKEMGCGLLTTEMVSAKAISYQNKNTFALMRTTGKESPVALQLFGSDPGILGEVCEKVSHEGWDFLDLNMGCPMPKIVNNGEGSALMKDEKLTHRVLSAMVKASAKPVTLKIRKGFDDEHVNAVEIARIAQDAGVGMIAVHARTREQYYSKKADWNIIREVKRAVTIPVVGNGDVTNGASALRLLEETGCDGVMIARAAQGNPWIFREVDTFLREGVQVERPSKDEVVDMILRHLHLQIAHDGEYLGIRQMRKHIAWYTHGRKGSSSLREKINRIEHLEELVSTLEEFRRSTT